MPRINFIIKFLFIIILLPFEFALAIKCLKAKTVSDLKKDFPVIVKGEIIERKKSISEENTYTLTIEVKSILHGKFDKKTITVKQTHYSNNLPQIYKKGKIYIFPIDVKKVTSDYEVFLTGDGCPSFQE